ncbi:MAG: endolytic transglycosylase MltG, partial [Pseudohongiellaceae bacterium]
MAIKLNNIRLWLYILVVCAVLRSVFFAYNLHAPLSNEQILNYQVSPGQSLTRVLNDLEGRGILRNSFDLLLWARISNQDRIRAGEYALTPGLEPLVLLDKLIAGDVLYHQLVLLEGWTVQQALDSIQNNANITVTLQEH